MEIYKHYITVNEYSRPGKKLHDVKAIVIHWTGRAEQTGENVRTHFEACKAGIFGYASAHYAIGYKGDIVQCLPDNEVAYHCGSAQPDPKSARIYTDEARARFGKYAENPDTLSPNLVTIGIELSPKDSAGNFSDATIKSAVSLCEYLCKKYKLTSKDITTHHDIVGWKDCPKLWTEQPELLDAFRSSVRESLVKHWIA